MLFLQVPIDTDKVLDRNFGISPDTVLGLYVGMLVIMLILALWVIYKLYQARENDRQELKLSDEKSREVLNALLGKLTEINFSLNALNTAVNEKLQQVKEAIKEKA